MANLSTTKEDQEMATYADRVLNSVDPAYLVSLGKFVWIFAIYEKVIVDIISRLDPEFGETYNRRPNGLTGGAIVSKMEQLLKAGNTTDFSKLPEDEFRALHAQFEDFKNLRNTIYHGRPIATPDRVAILAYQGIEKKTKEARDKHWLASDLDALAEQIAEAEINQAMTAFEKVRTS
ncbi:MAG: hypothetical protein M3O74_13885 [Pseudomonadota bacterium]|nr:hypothetical protein [Pseudomonadota bacterium]